MISFSESQLESPLDQLKKAPRVSLQWFNEDEQAEEEAGLVAFRDESRGRSSSAAASDGLPMTMTMGADEEDSGPLAWVEEHRFQTLVGLVISANAIIIGFETDIESEWWFWIEQALLIFFVFELGTRWLHNGPRFFDPGHRLGNIVDVSIVMSGVLDMWMMPTFQALMQFITQSEEKHERNPILQALGILRMLRIIRLVRLVKIVQPLYRLATGVLEAMQGMFWVLVFLGMLLYAVAIICTRLIGHGAVLPEDPGNEDLKEIRQMFHSVFSSMFVLFELMSCWSLIPLAPLFTRMPILRLIFVLFYIFSAWALLAVMTGVVSEKMIAVREQITADEDSHKKGNLNVADIEAKFQKADRDNSLVMTKMEFDTMMGDAETMRELMQHANVNAQDLQDLFTWLDADKDGSISIKEFVEGFRWLNDNVSPKSFVKLQEYLSSDLRVVEVQMVQFINERFDRVIAAVRKPLRKINAVSTQVQRLDATCNDMSNHLKERRHTRLTRQGLAEAERRISGRLDALLTAVETLANLQKEGLLTTVDAPAPPGKQDAAKFRASLTDGTRGFIL